MEIKLDKPQGSPLVTRIVLVILSILILYAIYNRKRLDFYGVYVVGELTRVKPASGGTIVDYKFMYNNIEYYGTVRDYPVNDTLGTKYFILILPQDPTVNLLQPGRPIPSYLKYQEGESWEEIPLHNEVGSIPK
jgi:hypothetical protein